MINDYIIGSNHKMGRLHRVYDWTGQQCNKQIMRWQTARLTVTDTNS